MTKIVNKNHWENGQNQLRMNRKHHKNDKNRLHPKPAADTHTYKNMATLEYFHQDPKILQLVSNKWVWEIPIIIHLLIIEACVAI